MVPRLSCVASRLNVPKNEQSFVEPLFIIAQANLLTSVRASAEGTAALLRGAATYGCMVWLGLGPASFGVAQLLHGLAIALTYVRFFVINYKSIGFESLAEFLPAPLPPLSQQQQEQQQRSFFPWLEKWFGSIEPLRLAALLSFQSV